MKVKQLLKQLPNANLSPERKKKVALFLAVALAGETRTNAVMRETEPEHDAEADEAMRGELRDIFTNRQAGQGLLSISDDEWRNLE